MAARVRAPVGRWAWGQVLDGMVCVWSVFCVKWWWVGWGVVSEGYSWTVHVHGLEPLGGEVGGGGEGRGQHGVHRPACVLALYVCGCVGLPSVVLCGSGLAMCVEDSSSKRANYTTTVVEQ